MPTSYKSPTLVMNIKREFFSQILATPRQKHVEYRKASPYWLSRLEKVGKAPFNLRLLNGMQPPVPEATVRVTKVVRAKGGRELQFHLGKVIEVRHWNRARNRPA